MARDDGGSGGLRRPLWNADCDVTNMEMRLTKDRSGSLSMDVPTLTL